jgi:hypothetical protein
MSLKQSAMYNPVQPSSTWLLPGQLARPSAAAAVQQEAVQQDAVQQQVVQQQYKAVQGAASQTWQVLPACQVLLAVQRLALQGRMMQHLMMRLVMQATRAAAWPTKQLSVGDQQQQQPQQQQQQQQMRVMWMWLRTI